MRRPRYAPILKKEDGHIDWSMPPARDSEPDSRVHAVAGLLWILARGNDCTCGRRGWRSERFASRQRLRAEQRRLFAGCGDGSIELLEVQLEGKKRMDAAAFLNGFSIDAGEVLL